MASRGPNERLSGEGRKAEFVHREIIDVGINDSCLVNVSVEDCGRFSSSGTFHTILYSANVLSGCLSCNVSAPWHACVPRSRWYLPTCNGKIPYNIKNSCMYTHMRPGPMISFKGLSELAVSNLTCGVKVQGTIVKKRGE